LRFSQSPQVGRGRKERERREKGREEEEQGREPGGQQTTKKYNNKIKTSPTIAGSPTTASSP